MNHARVWVAIGVVIAIGAGAFAWWRVAHTRAVWTASVPTMPDLTAFPAELRDRVNAVAARAMARDVAALGELSQLYHANGFSREAAQAYQGLEQLDLTNPRWLHLHAHILAGYGQLDEARLRWQRATTLAPEYLPARIRWAEVLLKTNQTAEAAQVYAAALAASPQNPYALLGLARCELQLGRWTAARERLQQAVAAQPDFGAAWNLLATVYERLGNQAGASAAQACADTQRRFREMADPWLDELLNDCYDIYRLRIAASGATAAGDLPEAMRWLERAVGLAPDAAAVHRDLGNVFIAQRDYARARVELERAIALAPSDEAGYLQLIACGIAAGDREGAERAAAEGVEHCPYSAGLQFAWGRYLAASGRIDEALARLAAACRLQPELPDAYHETAAIHFRLGREAEGVAALERVLAFVPGHAETLLALARRAIETGDEASAVRWLERARGRDEVEMERLESLARDFQRRFGRAPW